MLPSAIFDGGIFRFMTAAPVLGVTALMLLVAPTVIAAFGGADLALGPLRFSWYDAGAGTLGLLGVSFWLLLQVQVPKNTRTRILRNVSLIAFFIAAAVIWTSGFVSEGLMIRNAIRPVVVGWIAMLLSLQGWPPVRSARLGMRWVCVGAACGGVLALAMDAIDRAELGKRMEASRLSNANTRVAPSADVLLIVVDTMRADALGAYGRSPTVTPFLDSLAKESVVFEWAISQSPWTVPSMASLMTSRHPSALNLDLEGGAWVERVKDRIARFPFATLADRFHQAGYYTAAFVKNLFLHPRSDFSRSFHVYEYVGSSNADRESAGELVRAALRWAEELADKRRQGEEAPFFLYLHFMDPHIRYRPPEKFVPEKTREYAGTLDGAPDSLHELQRDPA